MTREEAIKGLKVLRKDFSGYKPNEEMFDMAIEALNHEPSEDGTLEVKVEDATKVGRVLISDDKHRGGLYYPDEDELQGDLISRKEAIEALGEEPLVWCDEEYEIAERDQWRADVEAIKSVPSADRPRGRWHYSDGKPATIGQSFGVICDQCGAESEYCTNYCPNCGADMRGWKCSQKVVRMNG